MQSCCRLTKVSLLCRTLTNGRSKMLTAMFDGEVPVSRTSEGRAFVDRDGERFGVILSFLRADARPKLPASGSELARLLEEAQHYQVRLTLLPGCQIFRSLMLSRYIWLRMAGTIHQCPLGVLAWCVSICGCGCIATDVQVCVATPVAGRISYLGSLRMQGGASPGRSDQMLFMVILCATS